MNPLLNEVSKFIVYSKKALRVSAKYDGQGRVSTRFFWNFFFEDSCLRSDRAWSPDSKLAYESIQIAPGGRYRAQKCQNWSKFAVKNFHADTLGQGLSKLIIKWIFTYLTKSEINFKVLRLDFRYILLSVIEFWPS